MRVQVALASLLALASGCSGSGSDSIPAAGEEERAGALAAAIGALESAGFDVAGMALAPAGAQLSAVECRAGAVEGLEVRLCEHPDEAAAKAAEAKELAALGAVRTGLAVSRGPVVLVVADRAQVDPEGKEINRIARAFAATAPAAR